MFTIYDTERTSINLHPLDEAIMEIELAGDSRARALARLALQDIWNNQVTAEDYSGNTLVIHRGQE